MSGSAGPGNVAQPRRYIMTDHPRRLTFLFSLIIFLTALALAAPAQISETKLVASDGVNGDFFGGAVAISGNTVVVGVSRADLANDENAGAVYVFERIDGQWREVQKLIASNGDDSHLFGDRVVIDGDMILVGAPGNNERGGPSSGAVYAFERIDSLWQEVQIIYPDDPSANKIFGRDLVLDEDRAFIGAGQDNQVDIFAGAAYVFQRQNDEWVQVDKLLPDPGVDGNALASFFGTAIGLDGDRVIISAPTDDDAAPTAGAASVFEFKSGQWQLVYKLLPPPVALPDSLDRDVFGQDVVISGDWVLVGSRGDDERCIGITIDPLRPNLCDAGAVFAHQRLEDDWKFKQKIAPEELAERDIFGHSIAMEGNRAVVGAPGDNDACPNQPSSLFCNSGAAYIFKIFNRDPVAQDDHATTSQNTPVEINVLANDSDPDFDKLTITVIAGPSNGTVTVSDTAISYTPEAGFAGVDSLTYEIDDADGGADQANVNINVTSMNAAPEVVQTIDDIELQLGDDTFTSDLTTVFSDPDGDSLTFSAGSSDAAVAPATVSGQTLIVEAVTFGTTTITATADDGKGGIATTSFDVTISTAVAVEPGSGELPTTFELLQNYPNPFNPETRIVFALPQTAAVHLAVFDALGREVAVLVNERLPAGRYETVFEASELLSGLYLYRLDSGDLTLTRTMLLLK